MLAHYHEGLASASTSAVAEQKVSLQTASDLLSDLQVETYSSMDRREKTEFILEQMRLLITVARQKDAELGKDGKDTLGGGEAEWVKVRVGGRKVNEEFLKEKDNEVRFTLRLLSAYISQLYKGPEAQVLRPNDSACVTPEHVPRRRQILLQGMGNALNQR